MAIDLLTLFIFMIIVGGVIFLPLGYFIYVYAVKQGEPFGDIEPHGDSKSKVLDTVEFLINKAKELMVKK